MASFLCHSVISCTSYHVICFSRPIFPDWALSGDFLHVFAVPRCGIVSRYVLVRPLAAGRRHKLFLTLEVTRRKHTQCIYRGTDDNVLTAERYNDTSAVRDVFMASFTCKKHNDRTLHPYYRPLNSRSTHQVKLHFPATIATVSLKAEN